MAKVAAVATGLAMATSMLSLAPMAHAATLSSAQIQSILGLLTSFGADSSVIANVQASLMGTAPTGGSTGGSCNVGTNDLTIGSTGSAVIALQSALIANGYSIPAGATGYFGAQTQAAVSAWQRAAGVMPAAGYFGPISRAAFNLCSGGSTGTPGTGGTPTPSTGSLNGTDGTIDDYTLIGSFSNEEVSEGQNGVKVYGADVEVSNDGDIALKSVKVSFDPAGNSGSDNLDDYLDTVDVWLGSDKIGSADVSDFTQQDDDTWTKTITVSNAVIEADETAKLYISVDSVNNIDSGDITGDSWTVAVESVRFIDGAGVTSTDNDTNDMGDTVGISFVSFSTAANTELKVSTASDSPEAGIVVVDDSSDTDNVSLLKGKLKLDGDSDVVLDEFPVTFTTTGAGDVASTTGTVTLKLGDEEFTESVTDSNPDALSVTITFNNLDFAIDAGDSVDFEVLADITDIDAGVFDEGDTLKAEVTSTNVDDMDVENSEGDQLDDSSEKSGTATGEAQEFRTNGIMLTFVSSDEAVTQGNSASDDLGTFTIRFKVTAIGDTAYVSTLSDARLSGSADGYTSVYPDRAGTATVGGTSVTLTNLTDTDTNNVGLYQIEEGSSETFEVTTTVQLPAAGQAGQFRVVLGAVSWSTDSTDATPDNQYVSNLDSFKTSYEGLN